MLDETAAVESFRTGASADIIAITLGGTVDAEVVRIGCNQAREVLILAIEELVA